MLHDIALEALCFFDRAALEGLQMHSRYLRDLVNCNTRALPLRYIDDVDVGCGTAIAGAKKDDQIKLLSSRNQQDLELLFHGLNNAFVDRLTTCFHREDLSLLHCLRTKANDLQCRIRMLYIEDTLEKVDYALVDFLGLHLRPQICKLEMAREVREDYATLLAYGALRDSVTRWEYQLDRPAVPVCIIPGLFSVSALQTCAIRTKVDPRPWIRTFVETFEMDERGTDTVRSVTLLHKRRDEAYPLREPFETLGRPRRTDVPTPYNAFVRKCFHFSRLNVIAETPFAELFVFENATSAKKLEVLAWSVQENR